MVLGRDGFFQSRRPRFQRLSLLTVVAVLHIDLARDRALPRADVIQDQRDRVWTDPQFCHLRGGCTPEIVNAKIFEPDGVPCAGERPRRCMGIHRSSARWAWKQPLAISRKLLGLSNELLG